MKLSSHFPAIALLCLASPTIVFSQTKKPLWDAGIRVASEMHNTPNALPLNGSTPLFAEKGILAGFYATRYFRNRWSIRGELNFQQISGSSENIVYHLGAFYAAGANQIAYNSTSLVIAPRYRVLPWLDLELALEARKAWNAPRNLDSPMIWAGAAVHVGNFEINLRYAPGYQPASIYGRGGRTNNFQLGLSTPLFRGKR